MIEISLSTALAIYSALIGFGAAAIWLYTEIRTRHAYHFLEKQHVWRCVFCAYTYLDEEAEMVSQCPRCASFNSIGDKDAKPVLPRTVAEPSAAEEVPVPPPRRNPSHRKRPKAQRRGPRRHR
jgi:phage FluMu protein Com